MITWEKVQKDLKETGMAGDLPLSTSEQRNITPKLTKYIFESGKASGSDSAEDLETGHRNGVGASIRAIESEMAKLKPSSERYKGMQKALDAVRGLASDKTVS